MKYIWSTRALWKCRWKIEGWICNNVLKIPLLNSLLFVKRKEAAVFIIFMQKMQKFSKYQHKKFISHLWVKDKPGKIEKTFYKKTEKYLRFIKWIPGLKMIWIWNSISMNCASKNSDIDLFIVTSPHAMWLNRIIITLVFSVLWVRKTDKHHAGRFCLSFFATTTWLNFKSWKIKDDIYLYFWIVYFKPIIDFDSTYRSFLKQNSSWADFSEYSSITKNNKKYIKYKN
jgi:predicted nucleotidyltransferase